MIEEPDLMSNPLSRDAILGYSQDPFPVSAFGGVVYVKPLSGEERDRYEGQNLKQTRGGATKLDLTNARARLAQLCIVERDDQGRWRRMFSKTEVDKLGALPAVELDKVVEAAKEASGLDDEAEDSMVESFNGATPRPLGEGSSSDSLATSG